MTRFQLTNLHRLTHVGNVRTNNEDALYTQGRIIAVADGMGGHEYGEIASHFLLHMLDEHTRFGARPSKHAIERAIELTEHALGSSTYTYDSGTTLAAAYTLEDQATPHVHVSWAGDSRVYVWDHTTHTLTQCSVDESQGQELIDTGVPPHDVPERLHHTLTNAVSAASAHAAAREPYVSNRARHATIDVNPNDIIMVCSDGVTDMVDNDQLEGIITRYHDRLDVAQEVIIDHALAAGGRDNASVACAVVTEVADDTTLPPPRELWLNTVDVEIGYRVSQLEEHANIYG